MFQSTNPATDRPVHQTPLDTPEAVETKLAAAHAAFPTWRDASFADRAALLTEVARLLREDTDTYATWMTREMGKPIKEARGEALKCAWCAEYYAEHAAALLAPVELPSDADRSWVQHLPMGALLGILPWNAPFWLAFRFAVPALMAGNTCLIKHDPHVPGCAEQLVALFERAGAAEGLFQAIFVDNEGAARVIADPRIRGVSFTGSTRGGSAVAALAGKHIKPMVLELGGSDPAIVLADANLDDAVEKIALMRVINAGQSCIAAKRVLVEDPVHDAFVEKFRAKLAAYTLGDPTDPATDVGPMCRPGLRDELHRQVTETVSQGATLALGGELPDGPGCFYPVTLLTEVDNTMTACREETFGPVAAVLRVRDAEHAIEVANDTPYGLAGSIFTSAERGRKLARRMDTGQVAINGVVKTDPRLPSGGTKQSGIGKELGPHGIQAFVNTQQVWKGV